MDRIQENIAQGCTLKPDKWTGPADIPSLGCLAQIVVNVINLAFVFLGAVALIYLMMGAIKFIVSRGDQKAVQSAQKTITFALLGLILILFSYFIIGTVTDTLGLPDILKGFTFYQP